MKYLKKLFKNSHKDADFSFNKTGLPNHPPTWEAWDKWGEAYRA